MIARTWHGRVPAKHAHTYHAYLLRTGLSDYASTPGNQGVHVLCRTEGDVTHFLLLTFLGFARRHPCVRGAGL